MRGQSSMRRTCVAALLAGAIACGCTAVSQTSSSTASNAAGAATAIDLGTGEGQMQAFMKLRGNADGSDTLADWQVTVFAVEPGKRAVPIMRLDGFNAGRMARQPDGGLVFVSREVAYYRDLTTGKILDTWENPFTKAVNDVLHVINDPVNQRYPAPNAAGARPFNLPWNVRGDDVYLKIDVPLAYPNPLAPADFPEESSGPTYFASEHFLYFGKTRDLMDPKVTSMPVSYAWLRTGPWLPWMKMGTRPGYLLYSGQGKKASAADLDPVVREYTMKNHPEFMTAPKTIASPNETSWTYYRKQRGAKK